jgi:hypothetical protein
VRDGRDGDKVTVISLSLKKKQLDNHITIYWVLLNLRHPELVQGLVRLENAASVDNSFARQPLRVVGPNCRRKYGPG